MAAHQAGIPSETQRDLTQQEVFDRMAPGWYSRRHWTIFRHELEELARRWQPGRLLNVGCGHGADFLPFRESFVLTGVDFSREMLHYAARYSRKFGFDAELVEADASCLPFADASFDSALAVASYHHLQSPDSRLAGLSELRRVLKPGGEAFVTVWNRWQPSFWFRPRELHVAWHTRETELRRYYYLFSRREFESLTRRAGFRILMSYAESSYRFPLIQFSRNICLLVARID
jgi:tRNA (uracil-5-)-methyltransferase TRM9